MNFKFDDWLFAKLVKIKEALSIEGYAFVVISEQDFVKKKTFEPNTITVVVKKLTNSMTYNTNTQPYQFLILGEQDSLEVCKTVFDYLAQTENYNTLLDNNDFIKFQFTMPVVLSNFNEVAYGYRTVLYMTSVLQIMENVVDITEITINNKTVYPLNVNIVYNMSPDAQQIVRSGEEIASSVKSVSSFALSFVIPLINCDLLSDVVGIINEEKTGNEDFAISFVLQGVTIKKNMKLISCNIQTAPKDIPTMNIGFSK